MGPLSVVWEWEDGSFDRAQILPAPGGWQVSGRHGDTRYVITLDAGFRCQSLQASSGDAACRLTRGPTGWRREDGSLCPGSADALDLDLSWSAVTNSFPIRRMMETETHSARMQVLLVSLPDLEAQMVTQEYVRAEGHWLYLNVTNGFKAQLEVDKNGLVTDYPGLCRRRD